MIDTKKMHPLDATEIALKHAAREWRHADRQPADFGPDGSDLPWQVLKEAARAYGDAWNTYVAPAKDPK